MFWSGMGWHWTPKPTEHPPTLIDTPNSNLTIHSTWKMLHSKSPPHANHKICLIYKILRFDLQLNGYHREQRAKTSNSELEWTFVFFSMELIYDQKEYFGANRNNVFLSIVTMLSSWFRQELVFFSSFGRFLCSSVEFSYWNESISPSN